MAYLSHNGLIKLSKILNVNISIPRSSGALFFLPVMKECKVDNLSLNKSDLARGSLRYTSKEFYSLNGLMISQIKP